MKQKAIITMLAILGIAGAISYAIIWWRKKSTAEPVTTVAGTTTATNTGTGYALPKIESYTWWINKLGHADFPLGMASVGVEVVKVQEVLNALTISKKLNASAIKVDGIWGFETQGRFKLLYPNYSNVMLSLFMSDFDPNGEILN